MGDVLTPTEVRHVARAAGASAISAKIGVDILAQHVEDPRLVGQSRFGAQERTRNARKPNASANLGNAQPRKWRLGWRAIVSAQVVQQDMSSIPHLPARANFVVWPLPQTQVHLAIAQVTVKLLGRSVVPHTLAGSCGAIRFRLILRCTKTDDGSP